MKRPMAYITAPWGRNGFQNTEMATQYCRTLYDAGYNPICPPMYLTLYLHKEVPQEHKDMQDMARDMLRRSRVLVVCGSPLDEQMKTDIATAERLHITATTLDGILTIQCHGKK